MSDVEILNHTVTLGHFKCSIIKCEFQVPSTFNCANWIIYISPHHSIYFFYGNTASASQQHRYYSQKSFLSWELSSFNGWINEECNIFYNHTLTCYRWLFQTFLSHKPFVRQIYVGNDGGYQRMAFRLRSWLMTIVIWTIPVDFIIGSIVFKFIANTSNDVSRWWIFLWKGFANCLSNSIMVSC